MQRDMTGSASPRRSVGAVFSRLMTRGRLLAAAAFLLGGAIVVNAVMLQSGKHPSPLFRAAAPQKGEYPQPPRRNDVAAVPREAAQPARAAVAERPRPEPALALPVDPAEMLVVEIQRELARRGYFRGEATGRMNPATAKAIRDFQFARRVAVDGRPSEALLQEIQASGAAMKEELLDLLKKTQDGRPSRTVLDVQRALNKAGYGPLTEDGQMGPTTRAALAKFEHDRRLPPRGEPKGPVLKLLASVSGVAIAP